MPSPPYNFATMPSSSQFKLLGGNITQVPVADGGPNTSAQFAWIFQNWSSGANTFNNWVKPAILNWKRLGGFHIRMQGGCDGVISGLYTQGYYETCLSQLVAFIRAQGMTLSMCAMGVLGYGTVSGGPSLSNTAAWYAPMQSAIANVYNPNADVIGYLEMGNQESDLYGGPDETLSAALCTLGAADTAIPTLISGTNFSWIPTSCALIGIHFYPQLQGFALTCNAVLNKITASLRSRPVGNLLCKALMEEFAYSETTFVEKAQLINTAAITTFGHPDVIGMLYWAAQGPSPDGNWYMLTLPSNPYDPTQFWADTQASILFASWGPGNRNIAWNAQQTSSTSVTGTAADVGWDWVTGFSSVPTETGAVMQTVTQTVCPITLTGKISLTGDPGSQYTISFIANDTIFTGRNVIGTPLVITGSVTNQAISISGTLPLPGPGPSGTQWTFTVQAQRTSGSVDGTITAMTTTVAFGVAPALNPPASTPVFGVLSSAMATKLARMRNTRPTRRQFLVLDDGSVEREA